MQQSVVISRYVFGAICALIVILAIALFISLTKRTDEKDPKSVVPAASAWIQDGERAPFRPSRPDELQEYFSKEDVGSVLLFKEDGRFRWLDKDGNELKICGQTLDGRIRGCGIEGKKVELTTFTEFTVIGIKGSVCQLGGTLGYTGWNHSGCPHTH